MLTHSSYSASPSQWRISIASALDIRAAQVIHQSQRTFASRGRLQKSPACNRIHHAEIPPRATDTLAAGLPCLNEQPFSRLRAFWRNRKGDARAELCRMPHGEATA